MHSIWTIECLDCVHFQWFYRIISVVIALNEHRLRFLVGTVPAQDTTLWERHDLDPLCPPFSQRTGSQTHLTQASELFICTVRLIYLRPTCSNHWKYFATRTINLNDKRDDILWIRQQTDRDSFVAKYSKHIRDWDRVLLLLHVTFLRCYQQGRNFLAHSMRLTSF